MLRRKESRRSDTINIVQRSDIGLRIIVLTYYHAQVIRTFGIIRLKSYYSRYISNATVEERLETFYTSCLDTF